MGIIGNVLIDSRNLLYFALYFLPSFYLVMMMIYRDYILEFALTLTQKIPWLNARILLLLEHVIKPRIILFVHHPEKLYKSLEYIRRNETSRRITVVFCPSKTENTTALTKKFIEHINFFKEAQIFPDFNLSFEVYEEHPFGPAAIRSLVQRFRISTNYVFIGSIHHFHSFSFEDLGGVRVIQ